MRPTYLKIIHSILIPGGLLLTAVLLLFFRTSLPLWLSGFLEIYPYLVLIGGLLLGLILGRSRMVLALLLLGLAAWGMLSSAKIVDGALINPLPFMVLILIPPNIALISIYFERGIFNPLTIIRILAIAFQFIIVLFINAFYPEGAAGFIQANGGILLTIILAASVITITIKLIIARGPMEAAFLWILADVLLIHILKATGMSAELPYSFMVKMLTGTAGLILIVSSLISIHSMAYRDELTGLPSRRAMNEFCKTLGRRYCVAMIDIDHFKKFNDRHGHEVGDQVLRMVAAKIASAPGRGRAFRYGGEEFTVFYPGRDLEDIRDHLEEMRGIIQKSAFQIRSSNRPDKQKRVRFLRGLMPVGKKLSVTISIGAAQKKENKQTPEDVINAADKALYKAKRTGRNRVSA